MTRHSHRFDQRRMVHAQIVRQNVDGVRGNDPDLLHGAIGIEAQEFQLVTDVLVTSFTGRAVATVIKGAHDHLLTGSQPFNIRANRLDHTGHLVANHALEPDTGIHVAMVDMHIGAANAAIGNANRNLARTGCRGWRLIDGERLVAPVVSGGNGG